jgi:hypothetical protein
LTTPTLSVHGGRLQVLSRSLGRRRAAPPVTYEPSAQMAPGYHRPTVLAWACAPETLPRGSMHSSSMALTAVSSTMVGPGETRWW